MITERTFIGLVLGIVILSMVLVWICIYQRCRRSGEDKTWAGIFANIGLAIYNVSLSLILVILKLIN